MNKIRNDETWHVILQLDYEDKACIVTISIPDVPSDHQITVGEAIMNFDRLFEDTDSLSCTADDGEVISVPLNDETPKSSQILMMTNTITVMTEGEYREFVSTHWDDELEQAGITNQGNLTVN